MKHTDGGRASELSVRRPEGIGMRVVSLDGTRPTDEAAFWCEYVSAVQPEGADRFGRNLAAFRDAVTAGGPGWPGGRCRLQIIEHAATGLSPEFIRQLVEIAHEAPGFELVLA